MKAFYVFLLLLIANGSACVGQKVEKVYAYSRLPLVEDKVVYTGVLPVADISQNELFARAKQWGISAVSGSPDTTCTRNAEAGMLVIHGLIQQPPIGAFKDPNSYGYTCTVYVKEGKYKYQIDQIRWTYSTLNIGGQAIDGPTTYPVEHLRILRQNHYVEDRAKYLDEQVKQLISSLDMAMTHGRVRETVTW